MSRTFNIGMAISEAVEKEMDRDDKVILMGEDMTSLAGALGTFQSVMPKYADRCLDLPISETGFTHFANGAALAGLRTIVDYNISDFALLASDGIINGAPKARFCSIGNASVPTTFLMANGGVGTYGECGLGVNHSQCIESLYFNIPGLKVVMPHYPSDVYGLLRSAISDNDPVVFLYHIGSLGGLREEVDFEPCADYTIPLTNAAKVVKEGSDITIVAIQSMIPVVEKAIAQLEEKGISVEMIDPRVLVPFDAETVYQSVKKTGKLMIVHEAPTRGSFAGEIVKTIMEKDADAIKKPIKDLGALNTPIGSGFYEGMIMPHVEDVVAAAEEMMK